MSSGSRILILSDGGDEQPFPCKNLYKIDESGANRLACQQQHKKSA